MKPSKFQFLNPYLVEVNFVTNPDFISGKNDDDVEMQNVFNVQVRKSKNENRANVELTLETNAENDQAPFKLKIKVASDFKWEDLSDERVESMLKMNAPAHVCWKKVTGTWRSVDVRCASVGCMNMHLLWMEITVQRI